MRAGRLHGGLLGIAALLLALLLACGLGGAGVRAGVATPPDVDISLGAARLIARTSTIPYCTGLIAPDCIANAGVPVARVYTAWLFIRTEPGSWRNADIRQLVSLTLSSGRRGP